MKLYVAVYNYDVLQIKGEVGVPRLADGVPCGY
jgi:hypothetical protein